jgi:hypothetical protein
MLKGYYTKEMLGSCVDQRVFEVPPRPHTVTRTHSLSRVSCVVCRVSCGVWRVVCVVSCAGDVDGAHAAGARSRDGRAGNPDRLVLVSLVPLPLHRQTATQGTRVHASCVSCVCVVSCRVRTR